MTLRELEVLTSSLLQKVYMHTCVSVNSTFHCHASFGENVLLFCILIISALPVSFSHTTKIFTCAYKNQNIISAAVFGCAVYVIIVHKVWRKGYVLGIIVQILCK